MKSHASFYYEFGCFRLDPTKRLLSENGNLISLAPKAFETLLLLIEKEGEVVRKEYLMKEVWPDTFVEEGSLARNISVLRKALGEGPLEHEYIQTITRVGYRFVARIKKIHSSTSISALAVLPFNLSNEDKRNDYLGMGMADALITKLTNVRHIIIRPTSAVLKYQDGVKDPLAVGRELNTDAILSGYIQRVDNYIRVSVQMFNVHDGSSIWADNFDEQFTNVFALQDSISEKIIEILMLKLTHEQRKQVTKRQTENTDAYLSYLKGRYCWSKRDPESLKKGIEFFRRAIQLDSNYALAYAGLSDCYILLIMYGVVAPQTVTVAAKEVAQTAISLDADLAEAWTSLAYLQAVSVWAWEASDKGFKTAIRLSPGYSTAHHWYGIFLLMRGKMKEALRELTIAQTYDPLSLSINTDIGWAHYFGRRYDQAIEHYLKVIELDPHFLRVYWFLGQSYIQVERFDEALAAYQRALQLNDHPLALAFLGHAYGLTGRREEALSILAELQDLSTRRYIAPYFIALIYISLKEHDQAFEWLSKALEDRFWVLAFLDVDPTFDYLRADPQYARFKQLVEAAIVM